MNSQTQNRIIAGLNGATKERNAAAAELNAMKDTDALTILSQLFSRRSARQETVERVLAICNRWLSVGIIPTIIAVGIYSYIVMHSSFSTTSLTIFLSTLFGLVIFDRYVNLRNRPYLIARSLVNEWNRTKRGSVLVVLRMMDICHQHKITSLNNPLKQNLRKLTANLESSDMLELSDRDHAVLFRCLNECHQKDRNRDNLLCYLTLLTRFGSGQYLTRFKRWKSFYFGNRVLIPTHKSIHEAANMCEIVLKERASSSTDDRVLLRPSDQQGSLLSIPESNENLEHLISPLDRKHTSNISKNSKDTIKIETEIDPATMNQKQG